MKPHIKIVNSSSFGKHFPDHLERLTSFAEISRVDVPADISGDDLAAKLKGAHGIIASVTPRFPRVTLEALPELVLLARHGIGCDNVDVAAAAELGIPVSRVQGGLERNAVAEHAVALMLSAARYIPSGARSVQASRWADRAKMIGMELHGKRVGLLGIGNIGSRVAEIMRLGFQSEVLAVDPGFSPEEIRRRHAEPSDLMTVLKTCDVISFHCPVNERSKRMLGREQFAAMKPGTILVNTCRGELLDETALVEALSSGKLRYYASDVVEGEPVDGSHRLVQQSNAIIVPHLGGYTTESLRGMGETMVRDCELVFLEHKLPGCLANSNLNEKKVRRWR